MNTSKIFIHGLGQTSSSWNDVIGEIENSFCPDLKQFINQKKVTYEVLYEKFSDYCNQFEKIDLCGISLGAILALEYTIKNPSKISSLTLIAVQYKIPKLLFNIQGLIFKILPKMLFKNQGFTKNDFITLTNSMKYLDFTDQVLEIQCPTLIICGQKDYPNLKASKKLHRMLMNSKLSIIQGSKHEVNLEASKTLSKLLISFYLKTPSN